MARGIRVAAMIAASAALAGVVLSAGATGALPSGKKPLLIGNCKKATFKPSTVVLACGDANFQATAMVWSSWTRLNAVGTGTGAVNDCTPNCAQGHVKEAPIQLKPGRPRKCDNGKVIFTKVKFSWLREVPQGSTVTGSVALGCKLFNV